MCLSIAVNKPDHVLSRGEHEGFQWVTVHNGMQYRCGYVRVPVGHPWHGESFGDIDADVHGGLTFSDADVECDAPGDDNAWWVGFDCAHAGDAPDPSLPHDRPAWPSMCDHVEYDVIRSQDYVESECRNLCEQAARAAVEQIA